MQLKFNHSTKPSPTIAAYVSDYRRTSYKKGDIIGQKYYVRDVLGEGGFGIVYLVYSDEYNSLFALKTFLDVYVEDVHIREHFRNEANIWINLEYHPYLVHSYFVEEVAGQLFIAMEYIPKDERGWNTLSDYLAYSVPDLSQTLRWAIQFCHGMGYAYLKGIRSHRDIKPENILITSDQTVKITDFGISSLQDVIRASIPFKLDNSLIGSNRVAMTMDGVCFGTPAYMSPEQFIDMSSCDERSDIYSFGIVLYQLISGGKLPFNADGSGDVLDYYFSMLVHHSKSSVSPVRSPIFPIIQRCLEKNPLNRYKSFEELREELEPILFSYTGEYVFPTMLEPKEIDWNVKGISLDKLGRQEEALACFDKAITIHVGNIGAWVNKGQLLQQIGRGEEALVCFEFAKDFYIQFWKGNKSELNLRLAKIYSNKGIVLRNLGRDEESLQSYDEAIVHDSSFYPAWLNKGACLLFLQHYEEAFACFDKSIQLNPQCYEAWVNKGTCFENLEQLDRAISCFDTAIAIHPLHSNAIFGKGRCLSALGQSNEALACFARVINITPNDSLAWFHKALIEERLKDDANAIESYTKFIESSDDIARIEFSHQRIERLKATNPRNG